MNNLYALTFDDAIKIITGCLQYNPILDGALTSDTFKSGIEYGLHALYTARSNGLLDPIISMLWSSGNVEINNP